MLKSRFLPLLIVFLLFTPPSANAQIRSILKNLLSEERVVAKSIVREESAALKELSSSKNLSKGYKKNIEKFLEDCDDVLELIDIYQTIDNDGIEITGKENKTILYLKEILLNKNYPKLYPAICQKFKKDTLKKIEVAGLLLGKKINGIGIDSNKLYHVFFNYSQTFAKLELEKLKLYYNCDETVNTEINAIAKNKDIQLNTEICKKKEETGVIDIIFTLFVLICIGCFFWLVFKKLIYFTKKLIYLFKKGVKRSLNKQPNS
jgi:hypothetical protein